jgi:ABC-2 type transport system permease protein
MIRLIRVELLKLRTIRLPFGLLAAAAGLTALVTVLKASRAGSGGRRMSIAPLYTVHGLTSVLTSTDFAMIMALVFGVIVSTGEFRHSTATTTYLGTPNRVQVLVAKAVAAAVGGALFGAVAAAITTGVALIFVSSKGYPLVLGGATIARYALGAVLGSALLAAVGVAVGSLIRSQVVAIVTVFAWGFIVEQVIGGLYNAAQPYLPYTAARTLAGATLDGGTAPLPFLAATALLVAVAVLASVVAAATTVRQDVA